MSENKAEIATGAAVLAVAIGFGAWAMQGQGFGPQAGSYDLRASFRSVEGITIGSDIRIAGVKVGTITDLDLNPQTFFADARLAIREDVQLPADSAILIQSEGLLGGAYVEIQPGGSFDNLSPGDEIEDTQGAVSMVSLMMKFVDGGSASPAPAAAPATGDDPLGGAQ